MYLPIERIKTKKELSLLPKGRHLIAMFNGKTIREGYIRRENNKFIGIGLFCFFNNQYEITELDKKIVIFKKGKFRLDGIPFELYALAV